MERTRMTMAKRRSTVVRWDRRPSSGDCSWSKPAAVQPGMASGARGKISYKMVRFLTQLSIANILETITDFLDPFSFRARHDYQLIKNWTKGKNWSISAKWSDFGPQ